MSSPGRPRVRRGDVLLGQVDALGADGEARGTAQIEGFEPFAVRVRGGVPGDEGVLRVVHGGQHAVFTEVAELRAASPDRVAPPCPVVHRCGGCPWQMVSLEAQRAAREALLRDVLGDRLADARIHPTVTAGAAVGYRTRALMMVGVDKGQVRLGFFAPRTDELVPAEGCVVQHPALNAALSGARDLIAPVVRDARRAPSRPPLLRALAMKLDPGRGVGLLTLIARRDDPRFGAIAPALLSLPGVAGVHLAINDAPAGQLLRGPTRHLAGARRLTVQLGPLTLLVGPAAFVQTHHAVAVRMVEAMLALAPERAAHVADLYAGIGVFGLALRDRADAVTLVEASPEATRDARANASRLPGATHVAVVEADAAVAAVDVVRGGPDELVILDPPRAGCDARVLGAVCAARPGVVLYASCNPASLARDLGILSAAGYALTDVVPFEMFPHTPHLEVLARFALA